MLAMFVRREAFGVSFTMANAHFPAECRLSCYVDGFTVGDGRWHCEGFRFPDSELQTVGATHRDRHFAIERTLVVIAKSDSRSIRITADGHSVLSVRRLVFNLSADDRPCERSPGGPLPGLKVSSCDVPKAARPTGSLRVPGVHHHLQHRPSNVLSCPWLPMPSTHRCLSESRRVRT